jgi:hypothetical protein
VEFLLSIAYAVLFLVIIRRSGFYRLDGLHPVALPFLFVVKLFAGVCLGLVYTYYYTDRHTADTFRLFDDSAVIYELAWRSPRDFFSIMTGIGGDAPHLEAIYNSMHNWYDIYSPVNDNRFMIRLNTLLRFFSFGNYYVHVVFVAFLSATGTCTLLKFLTALVPGSERLFYLTTGFLPSVLFWGSGLMKDAVVIFSLGITLYFFGKVLAGDQKIKTVMFLFLSVLLLTFTRFQILVITLPGLVAWLIAAKTSAKPVVVFPLILSGCLLTVALFSNSAPFLDLPDLLYRKQQSFLSLATDTQAGSLIGVIPFKPEFSSLLLYAPVGFLTALCRPFVTDATNPLLWLSALENMMILCFGMYCLVFAKRKEISTNSLFIFCLFFVLILFSLIGLVTPVLGAIVRYKTPALPLLMTLFILLLSHEKRVRMNQWTKKLPF